MILPSLTCLRAGGQDFYEGLLNFYQKELLCNDRPYSFCFTKDDGFNQIGNLIAGRGERPFAPTEEWRGYLILIPNLLYEPAVDPISGRDHRTQRFRYLIVGGQSWEDCSCYCL